MSIRVVIVDDEPLARLAVKVSLARRIGFELIGEFGDGDSAYAGIAASRPARRSMAILLTAYDDFALQAFSLDAPDYLLESVDDDRLDEVLDRAQRAFPYRGEGRAEAPTAPVELTFKVCVGARTVLVPVAQMKRIEADGNNATLHANGSAIVRLDMAAELHSLTNRDALLRLRDGSVVRASRTYMSSLADALQHFNKKSA